MFQLSDLKGIGVVALIILAIIIVWNILSVLMGMLFSLIGIVVLVLAAYVGVYVWRKRKRERQF